MKFFRPRSTSIAMVAALTIGSTSVGLTQSATQPAVRDFSRELANKMKGTFVVATAGALSLQEPVARQISDDLRRVFRDAHTAIGLVDFYDADRSTVFGNVAANDSAAQIADIGFDLIGLGNPQGADAALRTTLGVFTGAHVTVARQDRQPGFQHLPQGRAALIQGPNPVRLSTTKYVTPEQLEQLKLIRDSIVARRNEPDVSRPVAMPQEPPNQVTIFADTYVAGPIAGEIRHELASSDRQGNVLSVRNAKEFADFSAFSMPVAPAGADHYHSDHQPSKHVIDLAHEMVENGMDVFVGYGGHVIQGIEIYRGRPIFYGMGDLSVHRAGRITPDHLVAFIATSSYQDGVLQEIRIHPVDLGVDPMRPASKLGVPMTPSPEVRTKILADLQKYSEPFGTKITVESGVGVIRVPKEATLAIGQGIRSFGPPAATVLEGSGGRGGRGGRGGPPPF